METNVDEFSAQNLIKSVVKELVYENKNITFDEIYDALKSYGVTSKEILNSLSEIDYQRSWLGRTTHKLSLLKNDVKETFSLLKMQKTQANTNANQPDQEIVR